MIILASNVSKFASVLLMMLLQEGLGTLEWWNPSASRQDSKVDWAQLFLLMPPSLIMPSHKASPTMSMGTSLSLSLTHSLSLSLSTQTHTCGQDRGPVKLESHEGWGRGGITCMTCALWHATLVNGEWAWGFYLARAYSLTDISSVPHTSSHAC